MAITEEEWRSGRMKDGTPIVQDGGKPAKTFDAKTTGAFIEGVHVDASKNDNDAKELGVRIVRIQAEISALGAEALRVREDARAQLDALSRLTKYDHKEAEVRSKAANYDDIAALIKEELVKKRGFAPLGAKDMVCKLYNDNVKLTADLDREQRNLKSSLEDNATLIGWAQALATELRKHISLCEKFVEAERDASVCAKCGQSKDLHLVFK